MLNCLSASVEKKKTGTTSVEKLAVTTKIIQQTYLQIFLFSDK
jgi:hypothetical protein